VWTEGGFTLALFQGWDVGSEVLLEQVQLNFSFQNKFIILLPCGLLVDNNTFNFCFCTLRSDAGCCQYIYIHLFILSFHWNLQNVTISCHSEELLPFLSVIYPFFPPFSSN